MVEMNAPVFFRIHGAEDKSELRFKDFFTAEEAQKFVTENPRWISVAGWVKERGIWRVYYW